MKNALNNQVGMLGDMFLWLVANLKQGVIYLIKQALPPNKSAGSVSHWLAAIHYVSNVISMPGTILKTKLLSLGASAYLGAYAIAAPFSTALA